MPSLDGKGDLLVRWRGQKEPDRHGLAAALASAVVARSGHRRAAHVKLLRTIRLDPSDTFVFERAAEPGEWAVPGAFAFAHADVVGLAGKARAAFRSGFLGIDSLGWSTLVQVVEASEQDRAAAVDLLAQRLVEHFGAPDLASARPAAEEEIAFASALSDHPKGMLVAVARKYEDGGDPRGVSHADPEHRTETHSRLRVSGGGGRGGCSRRSRSTC